MGELSYDPKIQSILEGNQCQFAFRIDLLPQSAVSPVQFSYLHPCEPLLFLNSLLRMNTDFSVFFSVISLIIEVGLGESV